MREEVLSPQERDHLVWHYTDGAGLLSILQGQVLWATASGYLNDTQEVQLGRQLLTERFTALADTHDPVFEALRDRLARAGAEPLPSSSWFFILSASLSPDSLAMWRSYGGRGESYAIGLDPRAGLRVLVDDAGVVENATIRMQEWMPVQYDPAGQQALVDEVYAEFAEELDAVIALRQQSSARTADYLAALAGTLDAAERALLLIKHRGFREEQEVRRTVTVLGDSGRTESLVSWAQFRHTPYGITPYLRLTGAAEGGGLLATATSPLPIRAVAVSPSRNGQAAAESLQALLASHALSEVDVVRSDIPFRE
jgi:hypothetical protein